MIKLPTSKQTPLMEFPAGASWCICGLPKTGKTTFASTFPDALLIDLENGGDYVNCYRIVPKGLEELREVVKELGEGKHPYKTVVLDTIDILSLWIEKDICRKRKVPSISSIPYGEGRSLLSTRLISILDDLHRLKNRGLVLITHMRDTGGKRSMLLTESLAIYTEGHSDIIAHCYKTREGGKLKCKVDIMGSENSPAGSRHPTLSKIRDIENNYNTVVAEFNELMRTVGEGTWNGI